MRLKTMKSISFLTLIFLLVGCTNLKTVQSPDFEKAERLAGIALTCSVYKNWNHCYEAADKACPNGYQILEKEENHVMQARTLRIECKK